MGHGVLTKDEADAILKPFPEGSYLMRESTTKKCDFGPSYVISCKKCASDVTSWIYSHHPIMTHMEGSNVRYNLPSVDKTRSYGSVQSLIDAYRKQSTKFWLQHPVPCDVA